MFVKRLVQLFAIFMLIIITAIPTNALSNESYGFGYKKKGNGQPPELGFYGPLIEIQRYLLGDWSKRIVYLTFDNGYELGYTEMILDVLKENKLKQHFS